METNNRRVSVSAVCEGWGGGKSAMLYGMFTRGRRNPECGQCILCMIVCPAGCLLRSLRTRTARVVIFLFHAPPVCVLWLMYLVVLCPCAACASCPRLEGLVCGVMRHGMSLTLCEEKQICMHKVYLLFQRFYPDCTCSCICIYMYCNTPPMLVCALSGRALAFRL